MPSLSDPLFSTEALIQQRVLPQPRLCATYFLFSGPQVADEVLTQSRVVRAFGTEVQEERRYTGWLQYLYQVSLGVRP